MKRRSTFFALLAMVVLGTSCERIPPSVSIPGYGKGQSEDGAAVTGLKADVDKNSPNAPLGTSENPPDFFPGKK